MKKILFLLILLISITEIKAQYLLFPPQVQITTYADTNYTSRIPVYISANNPRFEITTFLGGWHWDEGRTMTNRLLFNQVHSGLPFISTPASNFPDSTNIIRIADSIGSSTGGLTPMNSMCMQWKPTL